MPTTLPKIRVTVWSEFRHEKLNPKVAALYPQGMHQAIAAVLEQHADFTVRTATLDEPEHGLTDAVLDQTDVLTWWGCRAFRGRGAASLSWRLVPRSQ